MERVLLITMKATIDRLEHLLDKKLQIAHHYILATGRTVEQTPSGYVELIDAAEVKAIRDDLWSAWFELKDKVK